jgi:hypothetical protein
MAARILDGIRGSSADWTSLSSSLRGSWHRQVGAISMAEEWDTRALRSATDDISTADALIGLAADKVASGEAAQAVVFHGDAESFAMSDWRTLTRWHWVGAELNMLQGDHATAVVHAQAASIVCSGRSQRHEAKSSIVQAAATTDARGLPDVFAVVREHGWNTLVWPLALVAADHPEGLEESWLHTAWLAARDATWRIEDCLPAGLAPTWRSQPGVQRLRETETPWGAR